MSKFLFIYPLSDKSSLKLLFNCSKFPVKRSGDIFLFKGYSESLEKMFFSFFELSNIDFGMFETMLF